MIAKKIIFFDGDGTLWYPKKTKYQKKPHWIYALGGTLDFYCGLLIMTPTALDTLKKLKERGIITIILSTHPQPPKEADIIINHKVSHFKLNDFFDEIHATRERQESKSEFIVRILKKHNIPKNRALMIGDSYHWDYKPARNVGVDALLIASDYQKNDKQGKRIRKTIEKLSEVLKYI
jgi:FMN phosphatase YigB (HAD superfamily)